MEEEFYRKVVAAINNARSETAGTPIGNLLNRSQLSIWGDIPTHHEPACIFIYEFTTIPWKSVDLPVSKYRAMSEQEITKDIIEWVEDNVAKGTLTED